MNMPNQSLPVSVVICAYNAEKYLERTLRSICEQTYQNLEILVINDASTDATASLAVGMAAEDKRIRVVTLESNGGIAHARQVGLESVRHDWLLFFDADDIALPTMIEKQVKMLQTDTDIIGVSTYAYICGEDETEIIGIQKVGIPTKVEFFEKYTKQKLIFLLPNTLFSKERAIAVGGYRLQGLPTAENVRYQDFSEDVDLWCRMADFGAEGKYLITIPEPLFLYRKTVGSLSTSNVFRMQEKMRWIKDCLKHRRNNLPERSFEEYRQSITSLKKLDFIRSDYAALIYKKMGFCYLRHQYITAIPLFALVCLLDPRLVVQKLKTQTKAKYS